MTVLAQLLGKEILFELDERELRALGAVVDAEILDNPEIKKALQARLHFLPHHWQY